MRTPDVPQVIALLDGRVETRGDREVVVRGTDAAELNASLVSAGVRVEEIGPVRRLLEDVVLEASEAADRRMIRVELVKMLRRPRTWATIAALNALPTVIAILLAVTDLGPPPGKGPPFLSAVLTDGTLFPLAALGIVLPLFLPVAVAVVGGDAIAGEAELGTLRYLLIRPVRRGHLLISEDGERRRLRAARGSRRRVRGLPRGPVPAREGSGDRPP